VYNYKKGVEFDRYHSVSTFTLSLPDAPTREIDIYARSVGGMDLVFEVKNRSGKKVSGKEVKNFHEKMENLRAESKRKNITGIFYSAAGFTPEAVKYLTQHEIMYTDFKKWWEEEPEHEGIKNGIVSKMHK
jgi:hypothetical protein